MRNKEKTAPINIPNTSPEMARLIREINTRRIADDKRMRQMEIQIERINNDDAKQPKRS